MKASKVLMDFARFAIAFLIEFARNIVVMMTGNPLFPSPFVALSQLTTAINDLEAKFNLALGGGKEQKANMRIAAKTLIALLRKQAAYVNSVAGGVDASILSSGFHSSSQPVSALRKEISADHGNTGEVIVKHKSVKGAKAYVYQRANDPLPASDSGWAYVGFSTRCKFTDTGLVTGSKHWYRIAWITKDGLSAFSNPVMIMVL